MAGYSWMGESPVAVQQGKKGGVRPPAWPAVVCAAVFAALFVAVLDAVMGEAAWVEPFDIAVGQAAIALRVSWLDGVNSAMAFLGGVRGTIIVGVVSIIVLLVLRMPRTALYLFCVIVIGTVIRYSLVYAIGRARPEGLLLGPHLAESTPSFPSGHTFTATLLYLMLALVIFVYITRLGRHGWVRWLALAVGFVIPVFMACSRLYIGVHYPTDIMGGFLLAGVLLCLAGSFYVQNVERWEPWPRGTGADRT